jgi:hypothetical protein
MAANATVHGGVGKVHLAAGHDAVKALQSAIKKVSLHGNASTMGGGKLSNTGIMKGSETVSAGHSRISADTFSGGAARAAFHVGADTISARKDMFVFKADHAASSHVIQSFKQGADKLVLSGYSRTELASALHSQKVVGGSLTFKLSDKTSVTISGLDHKLHSSDFIIK